MSCYNHDYYNAADAATANNDDDDDDDGCKIKTLKFKFKHQ